MEAILAIAAVGLLVIQAHRNYLIMKGSNKPSETIINVEVDYESLAQAMEASWPTVTVMQESQGLEFDYEKLAEAIGKLPAPNIIVSNPGPVVVPTYPQPQYPSGPYWQSPTVSEISVDTTEEINGISVRRFPGKIHVQEID